MDIGMQKRIGIALAMWALACNPAEEEEEDAAELTCDVVSDPSFCWTEMVAAAYACVDGELLEGELSADGLSCAYSDGTSIVFDEAVSDADDYQWTFSILTSSGDTCARYVEDAMSMTLTVGADEVAVTPSGMMGIEVSCPDGSAFATSNLLGLLDCEDGVVPGHSYSATGGAYLSLLGAPEGAGWLVRCASAE